MKNRVLVMLSTYNGERYIDEQISSIMAQKGVDLKLLIRDDGSNDNTMNILNEYKQQYENISVYGGENLGACRSFFKLIEDADDAYDYYAFADQDDVWLPEKLLCAINKLNEQPDNVPVLYCGKGTPVDADLNPIDVQFKNTKSLSTFGNSLIQCHCGGCSAVLNYQLMQNLKLNIPSFAFMHDAWIYIVACAFGKVIFDDQSYLLYRLHGDNTIGIETDLYSRWKRRIRNYREMKNKIPKQAEEFKKIYYYKLDEKNKSILDCIANPNTNPIRRLTVFLQKDIRRDSALETLIYKLSYLFWRL